MMADGGILFMYFEPSHLPNSLIHSNKFYWDSLGFESYTIISLGKRESLSLSFLIFIPLISFFLL